MSVAQTDSSALITVLKLSVLTLATHSVYTHCINISTSMSQNGGHPGKVLYCQLPWQQDICLDTNYIIPITKSYYLFAYN